MFKIFKKTSSYYDILELSFCASDMDVHNSFIRISKTLEDDSHLKNKRLNTLKQRLLNEAYAALRTQVGRNRYNKLLLSKKGKPKGLYLKADNDNCKFLNNTDNMKLFSHISELIYKNCRPFSKNIKKDHG